MPNRYRGEIAATLDGAPYTLCLTLGALAELEHAFGSDDMLALAGRFSAGRISAADCVRVIGAGLRGGGHDVDDATVARMRGEDGAAGFVDIVARLLAATFGGPVATVATDAVAAMAKAHAPEAAAPQSPAAPRPFPGPR
jgi:hypothetical protein